MASAVASLLATAGCAPDGDTTTVHLYYAPEDHLQHVVDRCNDEADGRYRIEYHKLPREADAEREQMVRRLAAGDDGMDVLGLDTTYTAEFAEAGWLRAWTGERRAEAERGTLAGPLASANHEGRLYAAPKNTNVQLLWYRADLVDHPPRTWDEMITMAEELKAAGQPGSVLLTGAQYEGLVVQFNTLVSSAGGRLISDDGERAVVDEGVVRALDALRRLAVSPAASPSLTNAHEDDIRLEFQRGDAAFQLNWPYVYAAMAEEAPELARHVRWARYPRLDAEHPARVTLGGYNLGISRYSTKPELAFDAALCLRDAESQLYSAKHDGVPPTIESVYSAPGMAEAYPMRETILAELRHPAVRPITPAYQNISAVLAEILSPPADIDPDSTADRIRDEVRRALDSEGVLP